MHQVLSYPCLEYERNWVAARLRELGAVAVIRGICCRVERRRCPVAPLHDAPLSGTGQVHEFITKEVPEGTRRRELGLSPEGVRTWIMWIDYSPVKRAGWL